nr:zinc transporter 5-like [Tanacetum cinerariifolium]
MNLMWSFFLLLLLPISIYAECTCEESSQDDHNKKTESLKLKLIAIASIRVAGSVGVSVPLLGYFVAMLSGVFVMVFETAVTSYFNRSHYGKNEVKNGDPDVEEQLHDNHMHVHTHTSHGHAHGPTSNGSDSSEILLR